MSQVSSVSVVAGGYCWFLHRGSDVLPGRIISEAGRYYWVHRGRKSDPKDTLQAAVDSLLSSLEGEVDSKSIEVCSVGLSVSDPRECKCSGCRSITDRSGVCVFSAGVGRWRLAVGNFATIGDIVMERGGYCWRLLGDKSEPFFTLAGAAQALACEVGK